MANISGKRRNRSKRKRSIPAKKQPMVDKFVKNFVSWRKQNMPIAEMAEKCGLKPYEVYEFGMKAAEEFWGISHEDALYRYNGPHKQHQRSCFVKVNNLPSVEVQSEVQSEVHMENTLSEELKKLIEMANKLACMEEI